MHRRNLQEACRHSRVCMNCQLPALHVSSALPAPGQYRIPVLTVLVYFMHDELDGRRARRGTHSSPRVNQSTICKEWKLCTPAVLPLHPFLPHTRSLVGRGTQAPNGADSLGTPAFLARSQRWFGSQIPCPSQLLSPPAPSPIDGCNSPAPRSSVRCFELVFLPSPLHARQRCICIGPQDTATGRRIS